MEKRKMRIEMANPEDPSLRGWEWGALFTDNPSPPPEDSGQPPLIPLQDTKETISWLLAGEDEPAPWEKPGRHHIPHTTEDAAMDKPGPSRLSRTLSRNSEQGQDREVSPNNSTLSYAYVSEAVGSNQATMEMLLNSLLRAGDIFNSGQTQAVGILKNMAKLQAETLNLLRPLHEPELREKIMAACWSKEPLVYILPTGKMVLCGRCGLPNHRRSGCQGKDSLMSAHPLENTVVKDRLIQCYEAASIQLQALRQARSQRMSAGNAVLPYSRKDPRIPIRLSEEMSIRLDRPTKKATTNTSQIGDVPNTTKTDGAGGSQL